MSNEIELIGQEGAILSDGVIALAENAEKRIAAIRKVKELALAVTNTHDWQDEGGKPYLWVSGAEKVARLFNVSWRIGEPEKEDHENGHYTYHFKGYFSVAGTEIEAIGSRSSQDPFFSWAKGNIEDISRGNVKKAAYTNCLGNGITRLLGIRNLTWDELERAGIQRGGGTQVDRSGKRADGSMNPSQQLRAPAFGREAKKPLCEVTEEGLNWYAAAIAESIDDPGKARFKKANETMLENITREMEARRGVTGQESVTTEAAATPKAVTPLKVPRMTQGDITSVFAGPGLVTKLTLALRDGDFECTTVLKPAKLGVANWHDAVGMTIYFLTAPKDQNKIIDIMPYDAYEQAQQEAAQ